MEGRSAATRLATMAVGCSIASAGLAQAAAAPDRPGAEAVAQAAGAPLIGKYAPAIKLTTVDGRTIDLAALYGKKPVYLKFWATWCVPCRVQMPHLKTVHKTLGKDIEVIALDAGFNETRKAVLDYRAEMALAMPIVIDDGRLADALNLKITPQHIVIGRDGKILYVGHQADARLDNALKQAIAQPPAGPAVDGQRISASGRFTAPTLKMANGEPLQLTTGGRPSVLFFFSPWCETYLKSTRPAMAEACTRAREQVVAISSRSNVRWVGVAAGLWANQNQLAAYLREKDLKIPAALDDRGAFFRAYRITDVPSFVVLNGDGQIIARTQRADEADRIAQRATAATSRSKES